MSKRKRRRRRKSVIEKQFSSREEIAVPPRGPLSSRRVRVGIAAIVAVAVAGATLFLWNLRSGRPSEAAAADSSSVRSAAPPKVRVIKEEYEFGEMRMSEERTAAFLLTNAGEGPLEISQVRTSCMCTLARVEIGDRASPEFNMKVHNSPSVQRWKGIVEPGGTAIIRLTYKPSLMPVQGSVARNVKFNTNDPDHPVIELGIHGVVL